MTALAVTQALKCSRAASLSCYCADFKRVLTVCSLHNNHKHFFLETTLEVPVQSPESITSTPEQRRDCNNLLHLQASRWLPFWCSSFSMQLPYGAHALSHTGTQRSGCGTWIRAVKHTEAQNFASTFKAAFVFSLVPSLVQIPGQGRSCFIWCSGAEYRLLIGNSHFFLWRRASLQLLCWHPQLCSPLLLLPTSCTNLFIWALQTWTPAAQPFLQQNVVQSHQSPSPSWSLLQCQLEWIFCGGSFCHADISWMQDTSLHLL